MLETLKAAWLDRELDRDDVARRCVGQERVWVVESGPFGDSGHHHVGVFAEIGDGLLEIADGIALPAQLTALIAALEAPGRRLVRGDWDAMWATAWSYAWASEPLRVHRREGLLAHVTDGRLFVGDHAVPLPTIVAIRSYVSADWGEIGVEVLLGEGEPVRVAVGDNSWAHVDFTYDGLNLLADAAWAVSLGQALARALGVPWQDAT